MKERSIGSHIREARKELGLTQEELAYQCNVHVRTIQRIETGEVSPRMYTIRLINDVLGTHLAMEKGFEEMDAEIKQFREIFKKRKQARITIAITTIVFMITVTILALPDWRLFGLPKLTWAPFFYIITFGLIVSNAFIWRCPACNGLLGDVFNTKYCSKCGLRFDE